MINSADATIIADRLAETIAPGFEPDDLVCLGHSPTLTLPKEHPAPWSCQEEVGGRHLQEDLDAQLSDTRRRHVVRDARGGVVVQCAKFSKTEEEKLARFIAPVPDQMAEIERLESAVAKLTEDNRRIPELEAECSRQRTLAAELCQVLLKTSPGQTAGDSDPRITVAAKLLIGTDIKFSDLVLVLAKTVLDATGVQAEGGAA
jgi:hypothetical protein